MKKALLTLVLALGLLVGLSPTPASAHDSSLAGARAICGQGSWAFVASGTSWNEGNAYILYNLGITGPHAYCMVGIAEGAIHGTSHYQFVGLRDASQGTGWDVSDGGLYAHYAGPVYLYREPTQRISGQYDFRNSSGTLRTYTFSGFCYC